MYNMEYSRNSRYLTPTQVAFLRLNVILYIPFKVSYQLLIFGVACPYLCRNLVGTTFPIRGNSCAYKPSAATANSNNALITDKVTFVIKFDDFNG